MKDKILCWLDNEWIHFGIAKFLQDNYECDMFAIIDIRYTSRKFYEEQKIIRFEKIWYYRDFLKFKREPDIEYLKNFEKKFSINLWAIAYAERFFYKYNEFYNFSEEEILCILEDECKLFESVLEKVKPDYLFIKMTDSHQSNLIHQMCKIMGIKILMISLTRFGYRYGVFEDYDQIENMSDMNDNGGKTPTLLELRNFLNNHSARKEITMIESRSKTSLFHKSIKYIKYLKLIGNRDFKNYYANYGKTRFRVLTKLIFLRRLCRKYFIDNNLVRHVDKKKSFIYFPLHYEPERALLLEAPFYTDQMEMITNIAKSLPVGHKLYVKEHIAMFETAWRKISFYKKIMKLPNVVLFHPLVKSDELLENCSLVITISGTSGLEAAFYNKPSIVFSDISYSRLPFVHRLQNIEELPKVIRNMIGTQVDVTALYRYVNLVQNNTFEFDFHGLYLDFNAYFSKDFNNGLGIIPENKMVSFLEKFKPQFEELALEHIKKIKHYKEKKAL